MKMSVLFLFASLLLPSSLPAEPESPAARETVLYSKHRAEALLQLSDTELTAYCLTLKFGSELLPEIQRNLLAAETELASLKAQGLRETHPQCRTVQAALKMRQEQRAQELASIRKGLEIEQEIAKATEKELNKLAKFF